MVLASGALSAKEKSIDSVNAELKAAVNALTERRMERSERLAELKAESQQRALKIEQSLIRAKEKERIAKADSKKTAPPIEIKPAYFGWPKDRGMKGIKDYEVFVNTSYPEHLEELLTFFQQQLDKGNAFKETKILPLDGEGSKYNKKYQVRVYKLIM